MTHLMTLHMDQSDYDMIVEAMGKREREMPMPTSTSNLAGKALAEICRGWLEYRRLDTQGD